MSQLEVDKIIPQSGTTLTIGDSGDTVNFANGTNLNIDSNTLYIDSTNNRVGIGTTSPTGRLNIATATSDGVNTLYGTNVSPTAAGMYVGFNDSDATATLGVYYASSPIPVINITRSDRTIKFMNDASERMRIESSGNLLVGTTATTHQTGSSTQALTYLNNGYFAVSRSSNDVAFFNRQVTDGNIITLRKDGTTVGSIASRSGVVTTFILDPRTATNGGAGISATGEAAQPAILPTNQSTVVNNNTDLGSSFYRWKDLYLGGGLYVGGTGSANYLDDYEEGTWTPTASQGSVSHVASGYIKIGRLVTLFIDLSNFTNTTSTDFIQINGIPFAVDSSENMASGAMFGERIDTNNNGNSVQAVLTTSSAGILFFNGIGSTDFTQLKYTDINNGTDCAIRGTITYLAAS